MDLVLQGILSCSKEYLGRVPPSRHIRRHANERVPPISLPEPPSLLSALVNAGAPIALAEEMQGAYQQRVAELKHHYETTALQAVLSISSHPGTSTSLQSKLFATIKELYSTRLEGWLRDIGLPAYKKYGAMKASQANRPRQVKGARATFNFRYVPLLESFFEENSFPTHADKVFLAKKSGMTYKQIHVWFQNKRTRSRCRKERGLLRKSHGTTPSQDGSYGQIKQHLKWNKACSRRSPSRCEAINPLHAPAPPHAFPSTYSSPLQYEPFPALQSYLLPWPRRPSPVRSCSPAAMSVPDLTEMFSQLSVRDDHGRQCQHILPPHTPEIGAAVASITAKPFTAPLFATCRPVAFITQPAPVSLRTVPAPRNRLHPFRIPDPQVQPVTLIYPSSHATSKSGRKMAPLPKRMPQTSINGKRNLTPSIPDSFGHRRSPSNTSTQSSSSELDSPVAKTPEMVSSPSSRSVELFNGGESPVSNGLDVFYDSVTSPGLRLDSSALSSTQSIPEDNNTVVRTVQRTSVHASRARP